MVFRFLLVVRINHLSSQCVNLKRQKIISVFDTRTFCLCIILAYIVFQSIFTYSKLNIYLLKNALKIFHIGQGQILTFTIVETRLRMLFSLKLLAESIYFRMLLQCCCNVVAMMLRCCYNTVVALFHKRFQSLFLMEWKILYFIFTGNFIQIVSIIFYMD